MGKEAFKDGLRSGLPISLGYFAVSFSLGILMRNAGLDPLQGLVMSLLNNTSAGEASAVAIIAEGGSTWEIALSQLVINMRYFLMSAALCPHLSPSLSLPRRALIGFDVTDEVFAVLVSAPRPLDEHYAYGVATVTIPGWAAGTVLGIVFGNLLPEGIVNALSLALYGMFIAVVIPQAEKDRRILAVVIFSMALSLVMAAVPALAGLGSGTKTIVLTIITASLAALIWPVEEDA